MFALHKDVDDQTRANADDPLSPDSDATRFVTQRLLLRREIQFVADYMVTGVWDTDKTGTTNFTKWSDYAASDPIEDIELGKETILQNTGYMPNRLVLGYKTFRRLKHHPDVVDRFKYTSPDSITEEMLARLFEVEQVVVMRAVKNTAAEGATAVMAFVTGVDDALLCYANPSPGLLAPSAGYIFSWRAISGGLGVDIPISRFRMEHLRSDRIEAEIAFDHKVVAKDLGYFYDDAVD